jgi:hypothetical protein
MSRTRTTVYFDSRLHRALRIKAAETDQPISKIINDAVRLSLAEDAEDLAAFEERAKEPNLSFAAVLKDLRKRGKLREARGIRRTHSGATNDRARKAIEKEGLTWLPVGATTTRDKFKTRR